MESLKQLSDSELNDLAVNLVLGVSRSMSVERIRPVDYWSRLQSALYTAATISQNFGEMVSIMGKKLQIDVFSHGSSLLICSVGNRLSNHELFERFRSMCESDALYVVAESRIKKGQG